VLYFSGLMEQLEEALEIVIILNVVFIQTYFFRGTQDRMYKERLGMSSYGLQLFQDLVVGRDQLPLLGDLDPDALLNVLHQLVHIIIHI
jgi:hypothetical protein